MNNTENMKIKALSPWFGGKRNLASRIVELLGKHRVYWEPFCGSMAVLLAKPLCVMETVNDLHGDLINLARIIQDEMLGKKLYAFMSRTMMHEGLFTEAAERLKSGYYQQTDGNLNFGWACDYMLVSWMGRNGVAGTKSYSYGFCVRYTANGGHAAKRWKSVIESIPAWHHRLQNVTILNRDAFEMLERIEDRVGCAIYIDPPYIKKGASYLYDFEPGDHERLAKLLRRFQNTRVVVSYYDHPKLTDLYRNWHRCEIEVSKALSHQGARGNNNSRALEVLLVNVPVSTSTWKQRIRIK